jgi:hypothetical protein
MSKKPIRRNARGNGNDACDFEKGIRALMAAGDKQRLSLRLTLGAAEEEVRRLGAAIPRVSLIGAKLRAVLTARQRRRIEKRSTHA